MKVADVVHLDNKEIEKYSSNNSDDNSSKEDEFLKKKERFKNDPLLLCLKYVLDFYYGDVSLETILAFTHQEKDNFDIDMAVDICYSMKLNGVEKNISAINIPQYFLPCIIIDKSGTPFVLLSKAMREATLFNPIKKEKEKIDLDKLKNFKKVILIFRDKKKSELIDVDRNRDWFFKPIKSFWKSYIEIGALTFFINIFGLALSLFTMNVYNRIIPNNAVDTLFVLAGGVIIILLFDIFFKHIRNHIIENINKKLGIYFEEELMKRMMLVRSGYSSMLTGMKANLFREINQVKAFFSTQSIVSVIDLPFFFLASVVIYVIDPIMVVIPLIMAVIIVIFNYFMQLPIEKLSKERLKNQQTKQDYLIELISGNEVIKLSNATSNKLFNWKNIISFQDTIAQKIQSLTLFTNHFSQTFLQIGGVFVLVVGVFEIASNDLTVGGLIAVNILVTRAMVPVIHSSMLVVRFKEIKESLRIIDEFWQLPLETDKQIEVGIGKLRGDIEFKEVSFFYENAKYPSLHKVNLNIKAGEKIGIIGQTGAGKSTILRLLTGLDVPTNGSIFIDGFDTSTIHPIELRQSIGVMPQEPFLFSGSLKENIELAHPVTKAKLMEVIKMTGLEPLIKKSGVGDGMQVGEGGRNLSVGQRHLVALARAIIHDPSILILDEPTTGLDIGLEKVLVDKMKDIIKNKTLIVITHRFTALDLVNRVVVLNEGKIVLDGPKDKVLRALSGKK